MPFHVFEHTADIGIDVEAPSLDELFADAARGLFAVVRGENVVDPVGFFQVGAKAQSLDRLLVNFLDEFIFLQDAEGVVFRDVSEVRVAEKGGEWSVSANATAEPFSHEKHPGCLHVKATTRHAMSVEPPTGGEPARAHLIFDV